MISNSNNPSRKSPGWALFIQLCWREISESTKGSVLNFIWLVLGPLLTMLLYVLVFGVLFGGRFREGSDESSLVYALGVYIGLTVVNMVNETIGQSTHLIHGKVNFVKRVVLPLELLPTVQVCGIGFKWIVNICLWFALAAAFKTISVHSFTYLLLLFVPIIFLCMGLAWLLSAMSVFFRDLQQLIPVFTQIVFWSSGVFYGTAKVMEVPQIWYFLKWNPILLAVENFRHIFLWQSHVNWGQVAYLWVFGLVVFVGGKLLFDRLKHGFAELL